NSGGSSLEKVLGGPRSAGQELAPDFSSKTSAPDNEVPSLQTYKDDIAKLIQKDKVSVVTIAAAEAGRQTAPPGAAQKAAGPSFTKIALVVLGVLLIAAAAGLAAYSFFAPGREVPIENTLPAPFIVVD